MQNGVQGHAEENTIAMVLQMHTEGVNSCCCSMAWEQLCKLMGHMAVTIVVGQEGPGHVVISPTLTAHPPLQVTLPES